ncbi:DUF547 domain-containing protein [candidate division KSB1 bacterium]
MKTQHIFTCFFLLGMIIGSAGAQEFDHSAYDEILKAHVEQGLVDYAGLKSEKGGLDRYMNMLAEARPDDYEQWSREEQLAFWINAYNAITLYGIRENYPVQYGGFVARLRFPESSIRQISGFWDKVFVKPLGKEYSLNHIEHEILRKEFNDPRIHFAIVCASMSCPDLSREAYTAEKLDHQLDLAVVNFLKQPKGLRIDRHNNILFLSSIFGWYKDDFAVDNLPDRLMKYKKEQHGFMSFIMRYTDEQTNNYILTNSPEVRFLDYDWSLNEMQADTMR